MMSSLFGMFVNPTTPAPGRRGPRAAVSCAALFATLWLLSAPGVTRAEGDDNEWRISVTPYGWIPGMDGKVGVRGRESDVNVSTGDVLDNLDKFELALSGHVEARKGKFCIMLDGMYIHIQDDVGPRSGTDVDVKFAIAEIAESYEVLRFPVGSGGNSDLALEALGGFRYYYSSIKVDLPIGGISGNGSRDWVDPFIGLRGALSLGDQWTLYGRGDVGGFDIGSDLAWNAIGGVSYNVTKNFEITGGYRWLDIDYHDGSGNREVTFDVQLAGPFIGATFRF
jgi:hypothetical protein